MTPQLVMIPPVTTIARRNPPDEHLHDFERAVYETLLPVDTDSVLVSQLRARGGLDLLHDVEMEVTAELGRTHMSVRELLSMIPGTVIELDRAAGAPADLLVNGRLIARGEVVVIDENFGIRITEIVAPTTDRS